MSTPSRSWFGTSWIPSEPVLNALKNFIETSCSSGTIGLEHADSESVDLTRELPEGVSDGRLHIQFEFTLLEPKRFRAIKAALAEFMTDSVHLEVTKCKEAARRYCSKESVWHSKGGARGARTDLKELTEAISAGVGLSQIASHYPESSVRYAAGIQRWRSWLQIPKEFKFTQVRVIILTGDPGTGKTRHCYEQDPELYSVRGKAEWWDAYEGQKTILFDDFSGQVSRTEMLRLLDGYPLQLNVKGAFAYKQWDTVYITSNTSWTVWYGCPCPALKRRITSWKHLTWGDPQKTSVTVTEVAL